MNRLKRIILVRHGETIWNNERKFQGKTDTPLSEKGEKQALLLAKRLKGFEINAIYSSMLKRAWNTAKPIAEMKGIDIIQVPELNEIDFGRWEGFTLEEIRALYPGEYDQCKENPVKYGFHRGLPFEDVKKTVSRFTENYIDNSKYENIAVFSHAAITKMMLIILLGMPGELYHKFHVDNCSISIITIREGRRVLTKFNDDAHLEG